MHAAPRFRVPAGTLRSPGKRTSLPSRWLSGPTAAPAHCARRACMGAGEAGLRCAARQPPGLRLHSSPGAGPELPACRLMEPSAPSGSSRRRRGHRMRVGADGSTTGAEQVKKSVKKNEEEKKKVNSTNKEEAEGPRKYNYKVRASTGIDTWYRLHSPSPPASPDGEESG